MPVEPRLVFGVEAAEQFGVFLADVVVGSG